MRKLVSLSLLAAASLASSYALVALPSVVAMADSSAIEITGSSAAVDLQAMFDSKAKAAGCEGQALAWLLPRSPLRAGSDADPYSDFRFIQAVPYHGDIYLYYYSSVMGSTDPYAYASVSYVDSVGDDGLYHDSYSQAAVSQSPSDYGCFRKSLISNAYSYSVGSYHRFSVKSLESPYSSGFYRGCDGFEICWQDVADGSDPIARTFSDNRVVIARKLCVLDCVLVPRVGNWPNSSLENFWCFFDLGASSSAITSLDSLTSARVSYFHSSYVASEHRPTFCDWRNVSDGHVYGGLYGDDSDYLSYLGDSWDESGSFMHYPSRAVSYVSYDSYAVDPEPTVFDVSSSGVTVVTVPNTGDPLNQAIFGHDDLVYSYDSIQKLDDASLAALQLKESFQETEGARVKPFADLCREYRDYSDSEGSGSYDYAILLNDRAYERSVVSQGLCWEGYYTNTACDQIDSVRLLTLTFHNDLLGGDIAFSCVDVPTDTTVAHITQPYTVHVKGVVDYVADAWGYFLTALKILVAIAVFAALAFAASFVIRAFSGVFGWLRNRRTDRRLRSLERPSKGKRR